MHAFVLVITVFLAAQPAHDGKPMIPAHAEVQAVIAPSADDCRVGGAILTNQLQQDPRVSFATWGCFDVSNPKDKAA